MCSINGEDTDPEHRAGGQVMWWGGADFFFSVKNLYEATQMRLNPSNKVYLLPGVRWIYTARYCYKFDLLSLKVFLITVNIIYILDWSMMLLSLDRINNPKYS